jgi:MFS family permease
VGGSDQTVWLTSVIAITTVVLGPPVSQAADYWGRKWFLVILTSFGAVGAIIVSRATSVSMHSNYIDTAKNSRRCRELLLTGIRCQWLSLV